MLCGQIQGKVRLADVLGSPAKGLAPSDSVESWRGAFAGQVLGRYYEAACCYVGFERTQVTGGFVSWQCSLQ